MTNKMVFLKNINNISNTTVSDVYASFFSYEADSFNSLLVREVEGLYNKIISELINITEDQSTVLRHIFEKFKDVQKLIDPNRLKDFSYSMTEDDDLVLSRNNEFEAINLIIHPEDDFSFSIIHKYKGSSLTYYNNNEADFEQIVYSFLK